MAPLTAILLTLGLVVLLFLVLDWWVQGRRRRLGATAGTLVAVDDSRQPPPTLSSPRLGLVGRPDELLRVGEAIIPVEHKPRSGRAQPSHVLQVAAQCALVADRYGVRPPFGLLVLADGVQHQVPYTPELEAELAATMARMRALLAADTAPGRRWQAPKCRKCGYYPICWE